MMIPAKTSALIAAFLFGIVVNAASAALFLNVRGHGSSIFRDGKRLVLVIFFLSAALWAQIDFITIIIGSTGATSCQVGVIFTTLFDQLARYTVEQYLLWVLNAGTGAGVGQYLPQGLLFGRFILGAVFVGFSRQQVDTVCVPVSSILALAIAVIAVDAAVLAVLAARAVSVGLFKNMSAGGQESARGKAVVAMLIGLVIWMATSALMLLGISTTDYIFRSTVPAAGIIILIIIVTASTTALLETQSRDWERWTPEAPSPKPIETTLFIAAPPSNYPPSRFEDLKTEQVSSSTAFVRPREVPLPGQILPNRLAPIVEQGAGGIPVQGQLFPPMRSTTEPAKPTRGRPQHILRNSSRASGKPTRTRAAGRLVISNPVLQEGGSNPLDKVATIDLETAARQERARREGVKRATSTISKEVAARASEPALPQDATLAVGSATGAQLSPGGEDLRRRSPRYAPSMSQASAQSMAMPSPDRIPSPPPESAARGSPQTRHGTVETNIQDTPSLPSSPESLGTEPAKRTSQRQSTNGLAGNPTETSMRRSSVGPEPQKQETIMFVNNIVYDDPSLVAGVIDDAKEQGSKSLSPAPIKNTAPTTSQATTGFLETHSSTRSVVNRPRPIPRRSNTPGMDIYFPPIGLPSHKRSKSAGALGQRKYVVQSNSSSSTPLPPLPPPPQSPNRSCRPKPNDTKSMTYDEKMTLFFPQPKTANERRRRSSAPTLPGTPSFMGNLPTLIANDGRETRWWGSKTTVTPVQTRSLFDEQEETPQEQETMDAYNQRLDTRTGQGIIGEMGRQTMPAIQPEEPISSVTNRKDGKRASSPVLPPGMSFLSASTMDDDTVDWATEYSPAPAQQVGLAVHRARAMELPRTNKSHSQRTNSAMTNSGEIGIMLDTSVARDIGSSSRPFRHVEMGSPTTQNMSTHSSGQWYHRVGEETPRFSSRSRRGTPPVPLVLSDRPTAAKQAALVQAAETSPLPSPEEAFQMIQAQLKKYEQLPLDLNESPGQGRLGLLDDLEREMGMQETRWANMQQDLQASRDSLSTLDMSSPVGSRRASKIAAAVETISKEFELLSRESSTRSKSSIAAGRRATRQARMASLSSTRSSSRDLGHMISGSRASLWQKRLEGAQMEFMEYVDEFTLKRSTNLFSVSKADLGSPTPPDTDDSETENESWQDLAALLEGKDKQQAAVKAKNLLWTPPQAPKDRSGLLWVRPEKPYEQHLPCREPPLPGLSLRSARRKEDNTPSVGSTELWQKPTVHPAPSAFGLWSPAAGLPDPKEGTETAPAPKEQPPSYYNPSIKRSRTTSGSRPLTQRPPRRSKRITTLPDILEDPQPLPDKRGTLGIFQFPWGEKSDVAWVQPRPSMIMAIPGTMHARGSAMAAAEALEDMAAQLELEEYSSSFFDDFDDDDQSGSDYGNDAGSESDDEGFDESTLWEIASLLKSDNVPSRGSMFPPPETSTNYMVADFLTEEPEQYDDRDDRAARDTMLVSIEEPEALQEIPGPVPLVESPKKTRSTLWQATGEAEEALSRCGKGLPQPGDWQVYEQRVEIEMARSRSRPNLLAQSGVIESDTLWMPKPPEMGSSESPMWNPPRTRVSSVPAPQKMLGSPKTLSPKTGWDTPLWKPEQQPVKGEHGVGLPHPQDWEKYDINKATIRAKPRQSQPAAVESVDLWKASQSSAKPGPKNWLLYPRTTTTNSRLWQATRQSRRGEHSVGLPHPRNWETYDNTSTTIRAKPRQSQPAAVESVDLWKASQSSAKPGPKNWLLYPRTTTTNSRLWQVTRQSRRGEHSVGLPHPRNWETYDNTSTTIRAKPRHSEPAAIESVDLWQVQLPKIPASPSKMWTLPEAQSAPAAQAVSPVRPTSSQREQSSRTLWSAPSPEREPASGGLFDPKAGRSDFRTTSMAPAAVYMDRRPRPTKREPLDRLTSATLWSSGDDKDKTEVNWISRMRGPEGLRTGASKSDWEAALQHALTASYSAL